MKPIENTTQQELINDDDQLIDERECNDESEIKDSLNKIAKLSSDISTMLDSLNKKKKELDAHNARLEKLRSSDIKVFLANKKTTDNKESDKE